MTTRIRFGNANAGAQAGVVNGDFRPEIHHHGPPERVQTSPNPSILIPFGRDAGFVDREATAESGTILDHVEQKCRRPGSRTALVGLGGVGKSQLAIEYAYRIRERSPETWVFWIHASNASRFEQSVRDIAGCAKVYGRQDPKANLFQLVYAWLHNQANGPWVVILDNADDADVLTLSSTAHKVGAAGAETGSSRSLLSYIPHCQHGSVLVTSRNRSAALQMVEDEDIITVEPMNVEDAVTLFRRKLSRPEADDEAELATSLVMSLEYIPLAIVQAAAYISQRWPRCSVQQYLDDYQASDRKKTGLLSYESGTLRRDGSARNSILITWQISFDHIRQARPSAANMLSLMSFCDRQGIPEILLRDLDSTEVRIPRQAEVDIAEEADSEDKDDTIRWSDDSSTEGHSNANEINKFEDDVLALRNYAFIRLSQGGQSFEMHRLVQLATLEWLQLHGQKEHWEHQFVKRLCREMLTGEYENWDTCRALFPHVRRAAAKVPKKRDSVADWATVMYKAAWYCLDTGNTTEAENLSVFAMKARKKICDADDEEVLRATSMVASAYRNQGRWEEAEKLELQVVLIRKRKLGEAHALTLTAMSNLGSTYRNQGRWKEAEKLELRVTETLQRQLGSNHPWTLTSMANLALTYSTQGRWEEAEKLDLQVLEIRKMKLGADHPDTLTSMGNLASSLWRLRQFEKAEKLELQVIEIRRMKLGAVHPSTLTSMGNLACLFWNQGRDAEAERLDVQVMQARRAKLGADHPDTLTSITNLAATYISQGRWKEAEALERRVLETSKVKLGPLHPNTLCSENNLAVVLMSQGRWVDAEPLLVQVFETRKTNLGADHPDTLTSMANLACTYWSQARRLKAIDLLRPCVRAQKEKLGSGHPDYQDNEATLAQWVSELDSVQT